jgi:DNA polymerase III alpha subunit
LVEDGYPTLQLIVKSLQGYQNLCWLLTRAHADLPKGECLLELAELEGRTDGLVALIPTLIHPATSRTLGGSSRVGHAREVDAFPERMLAHLRESFHEDRSA